MGRHTTDFDGFSLVRGLICADSCVHSDGATTAGVPGPPLGRPAPGKAACAPKSPPTAALLATLLPGGASRLTHGAPYNPFHGAAARPPSGGGAVHLGLTEGLRAQGGRVREWDGCPRAWGTSGGARGRGARTGHGRRGSPRRRGEKVDGEGGGRAHLRSARRRPSPGRSSAAWLAHRTDYESAEQPRRALPVGETLRGEEGRNGRRYEGFLDADGCSGCVA